MIAEYFFNLGNLRSVKAGNRRKSSRCPHIEMIAKCLLGFCRCAHFAAFFGAGGLQGRGVDVLRLGRPGGGEGLADGLPLGFRGVCPAKPG